MTLRMYLWVPLLMNKPEKKLVSCRRCGTCCQRTTPTLHGQDISLVLERHIPLSSLVCLRAGEKIRDNVSGGLQILQQELVQLKPLKNSRQCLYFKVNKGCLIYTHRPVECRTLECWNTSSLEELYARDRIARQDIFPLSLLELIYAHEQRCSLVRLRPAFERFAAQQDRDALDLLVRACRFDLNFRDVVAEKTPYGPDTHDGIFGRPLHLVLRPFAPYFNSSVFQKLFLSNS